MTIRFSRAITTFSRIVCRFLHACIVKPLLDAIGSCTVTNEQWLVRTISSTGTRVAFRDAVRERDGRWVIAGEEAETDYGDWCGFEAAHIFPLAYEEHWETHNYGRWITVPPVR